MFLLTDFLFVLAALRGLCMNEAADWEERLREAVFSDATLRISRLAGMGMELKGERRTLKSAEWERSECAGWGTVGMRW